MQRSHRLIILAQLSLSTGLLFAQPNIAWQRSIGGSLVDRAYAASQTSNGGYVATGTTYSNNGDVSENRGASDLWVVWFDADGNLERERSYGGSSFELAYAIQQTADGGFVTAGLTYSNDQQVSGNHGGGDV